MMCLGGPDGLTRHTEHACSIVRPDLNDKVRAATRSWQERNAGAAAEMRTACDAYLLRAYGDAGAVARAKAQFGALEEKSFQAARSEPNLHTMVNCTAYIDDFSRPNPRVDIDPDLVRQIKTAPAVRAPLPQ